MTDASLDTYYMPNGASVRGTQNNSELTCTECLAVC